MALVTAGAAVPVLEGRFAMSELDRRFDLTGRVALVTGASSGLGVVFARALADAGATLVLAARRLDRLEAVADEIRRRGRSAVAVACDVTDPEQVEAAAQRALDEYGALDIAVANAGAAPEGLALPERVTPDLVEESVRVNLLGTWYTCQSAGRRMLAAGRGSIVVLSSVMGAAGAANFPPAYQVSKAASDAMTRMLAASWADRGVRVNALAPGWFPSELTERILDSPFRRRIDTQSAMGRIGDPDELVGPLLLLASDASSYMTGQVIFVDGGMSASLGATPYPPELYDVHAAIMPAGLGVPVRVGDGGATAAAA
jgi:NAD(P)-dependent dehydrogenase (short-subunit alcohol dehydrogenase family)